jgi:signal transduction histidine kinase
MKLSRFAGILGSPLIMGTLATLGSLLLGAFISLLLYPNSLVSIVTMTFVIAAPISYLSAWLFSTAIATIEDQKTRLTLERERARILSEFVRDAAHEFKIPLTLMETNLYLLDKTPGQDKKRQHTQLIRSQIESLNTLLDTILLLTRLDSTDKSAYERELIKASELLMYIRSSDSSGRINVLAENPNTLPPVQGNPSDINLALGHLLGNALRFSPEKSIVTVRVEAVERWLLIQISDQGQGMSADALQHIFERFYRADESHTTHGLGLGLAIVKRVIELHDGRIDMQSELGKGTTVSLCLPISRAK